MLCMFSYRSTTLKRPKSVRTYLQDPIMRRYKRNILQWNIMYNENVMNVMIPYKRDFVTLNKSVINYLPRCSYHLLYSHAKG